ncbi:MAG: beta-N-acetylhexosaminidase [Prevotellaceae bacterium]|jgi:hexosaminidase|nr:beta-N-acetylhexosaminidase [Prevotellaceae bacterium]
MQRILFLVTLVTLPIMAVSQQHFDLVPLPVQTIQQSGNFYLLPQGRILVMPSGEDTANYLAVKLREATKYKFPVVKSNNPASQMMKGDIVLLTTEGLPLEGYTLCVDSDNVTICASDASGLFYGGQTLLQLLPPVVYSANSTGWEDWKIPCVEINDHPRFGHRGLMLDVSRQFYQVATVKKYLDWMAMHKLNVFHWHLTDDNGWRIEIKKYPKLTQLGAWRGPNEVLPPSYGSGNKRYGGYYTQQEIKEVVEYAKKLHINIIPEIDLPGHAKAAVATYPEIRCQSTDLSLSVNGENLNLWCVGREDNYKMLDNIIGEIAALFPWSYIHIGGDEVNPAPWKECPHCRALMEKEGMAQAMDLQTYFVKRMEQIVHKHGKKMVGWDEITDRGTISPTTTVTAWRGVNKALEAIEKGHPVIMQPGPYTYLDMKQSPQERGHSWAAIVTLERIYSLDPVGSTKLSPEQEKLLLGVQAGLWGELLDRPARIAEYQLYPRLCALAEIAWTPQELRVWDDFYLRIGRTHYDRLYEMGIAFRVPPPMVEYKNGMVVATPPYPWSVVRFTDNDTDPHAHSPLLNTPIATNEPWNYRFATFYRDRYRSTVVAGGDKKYQSPATSVEASFVLQPRFSLDNLTDYNPSTYVRTVGPLKKGDYLLYTFDEPLNSKKIHVHTGIPLIELFYVESGYVEYSLDGEIFIPVGELVYGCIDFVPPMGIKAVRIVMGEENYSVQNAFNDLKIE